MKDKKDKKKSAQASEEVRESGGRQNASSNQGGTADMDSDALVAGRQNPSERGSGITTKRTVTGSDFDGQVA